MTMTRIVGYIEIGQCLRHIYSSRYGVLGKGMCGGWSLYHKDQLQRCVVSSSMSSYVPDVLTIISYITVFQEGTGP